MNIVQKAIWLALLIMGLSYYLTQLLIRLNKARGWVDKDAHAIKQFLQGIPTMGGLAIFISYWLGMSLLFWPQMIEGNLKYNFLATLIVLVTGLLDDFYELSPWQKSIGIILGALVIYFLTDIQFSSNLVPNIKPIYFEWLSCGLTLLWIYFVTNAINLLDGLDGLATSVSFVGLVSIAITMYLFSVSIPMVGFISLIFLASSLLGFLPHNWYPAKIYLGDTGALFVGFMYATMTVSGLKNASFFSLLLPVLFYSMPIFDTSYAILRRLIQGKGISEADQDHVHHRLLRLGLSEAAVVGTMLMATVVFATIGILLQGYYQYRYYIVAVGLLAVGVLLYLMRLLAKKTAKR